MTNKPNKRAHFHAVYNLKYHLVLVTKYRKKCFSETILKRLEEICFKQCENWSIELLEFGGEADHIHLLLDAHPSLQMSKFINSLKTVSSRLVRKEFEKHLQQYFWKPVLWTRAYCLITAGGAPLSVLKQYIEKQDTPKS